MCGVNISKNLLSFKSNKKCALGVFKGVALDFDTFYRAETIFLGANMGFKAIFGTF